VAAQPPTPTIPEGAAEPADAAATQATPTDASSPAKKPSNAEIRINAEQLERARALQPLVARAAAEHEIDPNLLNGIIWVESKFNSRARNKKSGAQGLMQLMPGTSKAMAKRLERPNRPYDPEFATMAGAKLLSVLSGKFGADETLMLFAYARGGGTVRKWQKSEDPMPKGVLKFIDRVHRAQRTFAAMGFPETGPSPAATKVERAERGVAD
jgi:soluble lytic murein transglycosylase-like protein